MVRLCYGTCQFSISPKILVANRTRLGMIVPCPVECDCVVIAMCGPVARGVIHLHQSPEFLPSNECVAANVHFLTRSPAHTPR